MTTITIFIALLSFNNPQVESIQVESIQIYLSNKSIKSIPLEIPGIMNPNLSPLSKSGVLLNIGQEIYFRSEGKRILLLKVDQSLDETTIEVSSLIKRKKKELKGR